MKTKSLLAKRLAVLALTVFFSASILHTTSLCDWSSDVCSSDLRTGVVTAQDTTTGHTFQFRASPAVLQKMRSEERRVGKECRNQVSTNNEKKKCTIIPQEGKPDKEGVASPNNIIPTSEITPPNG